MITTRGVAVLSDTYLSRSCVTQARLRGLASLVTAEGFAYPGTRMRQATTLAALKVCRTARNRPEAVAADMSVAPLPQFLLC